jgi:hypothetical protein
MAFRIGALAGMALVFLTSASIALAASQTAPQTKPKPKRAPAPSATSKPQADQSYFDLDTPDNTAGGKPPNYVYSSQNSAVFRGSMVGGDSTLFGGSWGVANPGLR